MVDSNQSHLWGMRLVFLVLALLITMTHLLPMQLVPKGWAGPDILIALTFAWALRRPDFVPMISIVLALLTADMLLSRPPGLSALLGLLASEWLKTQGKHLRGNTFIAEWITVTGTLIATMLLYRVILTLLVVDPGNLLLMLQQTGFTILAYPLVAAASYLIFGVRRITPGEHDYTGRPL